MEKLVVVTTNKNKVERMQRLLKEEPYEMVALGDVVNEKIENPDEIFENGLDNAIIKSTYYVDYVEEGTLVLSEDDTIEFVGINEEDDPKGHIKRPVVKKYGSFTDENAANYYKDLAAKYGGSIPMNFRYGHSIAFKTSDSKKFKKVLAKSSTLESRLVNEIYKLEKRPGYFLASLMEVLVDGKWVKYNDLSDAELVKLDYDLYDSIKYMLDEIKK